ncbi:MAG TPA: YlmC/YmxH family sporulation protein [Clostridiales bacterium]|nr:YlmC/YmxH family sporulation protein [Clostridiales bacterium]HBJ97961.1 YlmC/YmxH family sporulation protein [Clostridiales bacterium]
MEFTVCDLKKKTVINVTDGKQLGRVCDVSFTYPQGVVVGIIIKEGRFMGGNKFLIKLSCVDKIGKDTVLVKLDAPKDSTTIAVSDVDE